MKDLLLELNNSGIKLHVEGSNLRVSAPEGALTDALKQSLRENKAAIINMLLGAASASAGDSLPQTSHDADNADKPFPLTDLQQAYWLGRTGAMELGNVSTHVYMEFDSAYLDMGRLNRALNNLIERHGALRMVIRKDGQQQIMNEVPEYRIATQDCSTASTEETEQAIEATRAELAHQILSPDQWPLFDFRATMQPNTKVRLHLGFDMLAIDASSVSLLLKEWWQLYDLPSMPLPKAAISFRDYVLTERSLRSDANYRKATAYWMNRVDELPAAPALPVKLDSEARNAPRFTRREAQMGKTQWQQLKAQARTLGLTPSGLILAVYAEVLSRWSTSPHFTVNVTVSNRLPVHHDVNQMLGPFTSVMLHEVDRRQGSTFLEFAKSLQRRFSDDYDHRQLCGVAVLREWSRRRGAQLQASMPVVFSSALFSGSDPVDRAQFGPRVFGLTQSSQVWLDHHVMEVHGDLVFNWDAVEDIFEEGVLDAMFASYCELLNQIADDATHWQKDDVLPMPADILQRRDSATNEQYSIPERRLHTGFVGHAMNAPEKLAIVAPERSLSYGDLLAESCEVANWLQAQGLRSGQPVAVMMRKGWEQIVAVYGILLANGAYMPIDADLPVKRQAELLQIGEIAHVLTQPDVLRDELKPGGWQTHEIHPGARGDFGALHAGSLKGDMNQLAYVIFTSGTTGTPKGVMIDHRGAMNTIVHVNRMFNVDAGDRVLAVSSLSFDLSVYDIFGLLDVGGTMVLPDTRKGHDPVHWRNLIAEHQVTFWNSAPQLMQMLMDSFPDADGGTLPLRTVLMSGDFIPLDLPERIRRNNPDTAVISLGGATEASIWSNYYPIGPVQPSWTSIPYGKALPMQTIGVYDWAMRPCADHVKGRIFLGGTGLAIGYWKDEEKTAARFITHPTTGERLYDTGDLGRYAADGNVLILGRDDGQIKIRGHRIELGEIEAVLQQHADIKQAVVLATSERSERRQLVAYVEVAAGRPEELTTEMVQQYVADRLPDYMVPRYVVVLEAMPLSINGKIDYRRLPQINDDGADDSRKRIAPRTDMERMVHVAWTGVFNGVEIGVTDNFFELGGDSVSATLLLRELNAIAPAEIEMHQFFQYSTIEQLAKFYEEPSVSAIRVREGERIGSTANPEEVLADIQARVALLDKMDYSERAEAQAEVGAYFVTGVTGWVGVHMVEQLLASTEDKLYCLVRAADAAAAKQRFDEQLAQCGIALPQNWEQRVTVLCGDLAAPRFGLMSAEWEEVTTATKEIFHFGASLAITRSYGNHSPVNIGALITIAEMATVHHLKAVCVLSPMTVSRRMVDGALNILTQERLHDHPNGLMTGYAQTKWATEHILLAASERGLPVRIFRTSHALPSSRTGQAKPHDTYNAVLKIACEAGVVPDWERSRLPGLPVDLLCRFIVEDTLLESGKFNGIVQVENRHPHNIGALLTILLRHKRPGEAVQIVALQEWKERCVQTSKTFDNLDFEEATLVTLLAGKPIENIFSDHEFETGHFERRGWGTKLARLTPAEYWQHVADVNGW